MKNDGDTKMHNGYDLSDYGMIGRIADVFRDVNNNLDQLRECYLIQFSEQLDAIQRYEKILGYNVSNWKMQGTTVFAPHSAPEELTSMQNLANTNSSKWYNLIRYDYGDNLIKLFNEHLTNLSAYRQIITIVIDYLEDAVERQHRIADVSEQLSELARNEQFDESKYKKLFDGLNEQFRCPLDAKTDLDTYMSYFARNRFERNREIMPGLYEITNLSTVLEGWKAVWDCVALEIDYVSIKRDEELPKQEVYRKAPNVLGFLAKHYEKAKNYKGKDFIFLDDDLSAIPIEEKRFAYNSECCGFRKFLTSLNNYIPTENTYIEYREQLPQIKFFASLAEIDADIYIYDRRIYENVKKLLEVAQPEKSQILSGMYGKKSEEQHKYFLQSPESIDTVYNNWKEALYKYTKKDKEFVTYAASYAASALWYYVLQPPFTPDYFRMIKEMYDYYYCIPVSMKDKHNDNVNSFPALDSLVAQAYVYSHISSNLLSSMEDTIELLLKKMCEERNGAFCRSLASGFKWAKATKLKVMVLNAMAKSGLPEFDDELKNDLHDPEPDYLIQKSWIPKPEVLPVDLDIKAWTTEQVTRYFDRLLRENEKMVLSLVIEDSNKGEGYRFACGTNINLNNLISWLFETATKEYEGLVSVSIIDADLQSQGGASVLRKGVLLQPILDTAGFDHAALLIQVSRMIKEAVMHTYTLLMAPVTQNAVILTKLRGQAAALKAGTDPLTVDFLSDLRRDIETKIYEYVQRLNDPIF